jgi:A/G-specific adenine glycosylase
VITSLFPVPPAAALLHWYDRHRRRMPWRALPGQAPDPYRVWLSEIMLQQTTVAAVIPYFERFLARFPTVPALAAAPEAAVMEAWAGLGYYARARNLHACARRISEMGSFPSDVQGLRALPGVGPYTAAAVASIAFGVPAVPVDGNVERVAARIAAIPDPLPGARPAIAAAAARLGEDPDARARPADFTQALFDLGATICTPRAPACALCPWRGACAALAAGIAAELPRKAPKPLRSLRHGAQFWLQDAAGGVLLRRRPSTGLLGGMLELPGTPWRPEPWAEVDALAHAPQPAPWRLAGQAEHGFTHFQLTMNVYAAQVPAITADGLVRPAAALDAEALPTVMRRCVRVVQAALAGGGLPELQA